METLEQVYPHIVQGFAELGLSAPESFSRTILLRDGRLAGQRFECGGVQAVMLLEVDTVDFYGEEGQLVKSIPLVPQTEMKKAA